MNFYSHLSNRFWMNPADADSEGMVGIGGDLQATTLLQAYRDGVFPWFNEGDPILWWSPDPRAIFEFDRFHISKRLARTLRSHQFSTTLNSAFPQVIRCCADLRSDGTWITAEMMDAYLRLHELGHAFSVESWYGNELAGGVYGVVVGGFFAAESMFYRITDGSKVALCRLMQHLQAQGFELVDTQMVTDHTKSLGAIEIPRSDYLARLKQAVGRRNVRFLPEPAPEENQA